MAVTVVRVMLVLHGAASRAIHRDPVLLLRIDVVTRSLHQSLLTILFGKTVDVPPSRRGGQQLLLLAGIEVGKVQTILVLMMTLRPIVALLLALPREILVIRGWVSLIILKVQRIGQVMMVIPFFFGDELIHRPLHAEPGARRVFLRFEAGELKPFVLRDAQVTAARVLAEKLVPVWCLVLVLFHLVLYGTASKIEQGGRRSGHFLRIHGEFGSEGLIQLEDLLRLEQFSGERGEIGVGGLLRHLIGEIVGQRCFLGWNRVLEPVGGVVRGRLLGIHGCLMMRRLISRDVVLQAAHAFERWAGTRVSCNVI